MIHPSLNISSEKLADICRRYHIRELYIFGSATREDFGPQSDVDLLVEYEPDKKLINWDRYWEMRDELEKVFGRPIDLVEGRDSLENPYRRASILRDLELLYAA